MRHLCQKLLKNCTIVNLRQAQTPISTNFPQNTALIKISPKIALFEVLVEPYKNRTISRIALIKFSLYSRYSGPDYALHLFVEELIPWNLMTRNSSQGKQVRKSRKLELKNYSKK